MKRKKVRTSRMPLTLLAIAALVVAIVLLLRKKKQTEPGTIAYNTVDEVGNPIVVDPVNEQFRPQNTAYEAASGAPAPTPIGRIQDLPGFPVFGSLRWRQWRQDGKPTLKINMNPAFVYWDGSPALQL